MPHREEIDGNGATIEIAIDVMGDEKENHLNNNKNIHSNGFHMDAQCIRTLTSIFIS